MKPLLRPTRAALEHGFTVLTANAKHFSIINGLNMEKFEP